MEWEYWDRIWRMIRYLERLFILGRMDMVQNRTKCKIRRFLNEGKNVR